MTDSQEDVRAEFITARLGAAVPDAFKTCLSGQPRTPLRAFSTVVRFTAAAHAPEWTGAANRIRAVLAC